VTTLGFLLGRHPDLEQRVVNSTLAGFLWGARGITQAGQHAMAEIWNIPGKQRPSFATRQLRGLLLLLVFGLGVVATTAHASLASLDGHSLLVVVGNLAASAAVNTGLFLIAFRVLTPRSRRSRVLTTSRMGSTSRRSTTSDLRSPKERRCTSAP
jgi:uncharacterized BrkB/YihY/UPF0761 family membrane protein